MTTLILANHYQRATWIARQHDLKRGEWRFVSRAEDLRGTRGSRVLRAPSVYERPDAADLVAVLYSSESRIEDVDG